MDQVLMVTARPLLTEVIDEGRRLIGVLRERRFKIDAAFWIFRSEPERWKMTIATPLYDREGPRNAYSRLIAAYDSVRPPLRIEITDIALTRGEDRLVKALQSRFNFKRETVDTVIEHASLDGEYVEAAYLYQLSQI
jgi:hypothetical protein